MYLIQFMTGKKKPNAVLTKPYSMNIVGKPLVLCKTSKSPNACTPLGQNQVEPSKPTRAPSSESSMSPGKGPTDEFTNTGDWIDGTKLIPSKLPFDEKKETEKAGKIDGIDNDNDSYKSKGYIFEELDTMEREFNTQIRSVLSSQSDHKLKILFDEDSTEQSRNDKEHAPVEEENGQNPFSNKEDSTTLHLVHQSRTIIDPTIRENKSGKNISLSDGNQKTEIRNALEETTDSSSDALAIAGGDNGLKGTTSASLHVFPATQTSNTLKSTSDRSSDATPDVLVDNATKEAITTSLDTLPDIPVDNTLKVATNDLLHLIPPTQIDNALKGRSYKLSDATASDQIGNAGKESSETSSDVIPITKINNCEREAQDVEGT